MECRDAQFYLRLRRHAADELGPDVTGALDEHLATCPACAADARTAFSFDRALAVAMKAVPVPARLRERLIAHAAGKRGTVVRRRAYRVAAVAAALLVSTGLALGVFSHVRPKMDSQSIVQKTHEQREMPDESLRKWLAGQKLPDTLPLQGLDAGLIVSMGYEKVHDQYIPVVVFRASAHPRFAGREHEIAKVYIFRQDPRYDLKGLQDAQFSQARAEVIRGVERHRGVTYVVVYTGRDLEPFLTFHSGGPVG